MAFWIERASGDDLPVSFHPDDASQGGSSGIDFGYTAPINVQFVTAIFPFTASSLSHRRLASLVESIFLLATLSGNPPMVRPHTNQLGTNKLLRTPFSWLYILD